MENQRLAAIFIALIAAMLVILAGRSCARSIDKTNKQGSNVIVGSNTISSSNVIVSNSENGNYVTGGNSTSEVTAAPTAGVEYVTDILGRVVGTNAVQEDTDSDTEAVTVASKEYVTDILGRVVEEKEVFVTAAETEGQSHIEYVTDILGRVVSTKYVDENEQEVTTQHSSGKNPLEEYREKHSEYYKSTESDDPGNDSGEAPATIHIKIG